MEYDDITQLFDDLLQQWRSIDMAEAEFRKMVAEDNDLHRIYSQWCSDNGSSERRGFLDYCEEYLDRENSVWGTLDNDFDR